MELDVVSGPDAARLAGITYRQLDYWARCGWVLPSIQPSPRRRLYRTADVVRLALLGHLGRSGVDVRAVSSQVRDLELAEDPDIVVVCEGAELAVVPASMLRAHLSAPGARVVFDPAPVWARARADATTGDSDQLDQRRSA